MKFRKIYLILMVIISRPIFAETAQETLNNFTQAFGNRQYASAAEIIMKADPEHNDPDLTVGFINLCLKYYAVNNDYKQFGFVNLKPEENLAAVRSENREVPLIIFDIPSAMDKLMKKNPERPEFQAIYGWFYYEIYSHKGHSLDTVYGKTDEKAFSLWDKAYSEDVKGFYLTDYGSMLMERRDFEKAAEVLNDAISVNPNNYLTYYYLALCYNTMKDYDNALLMAEWAVNLAPIGSLGQFNSLGIQGFIYESTGDYYKALASYEKAYALAKNNVKINAGLLRVSYKLGKIESIKSYTAEIFAIDPHEPTVGMLLVDLFVTVQDTNLGTEVFDSLAAVYKKDNEALGNIYFHKGVMFYKLNKKTEADEAFTAAKKYFGKVFDKDHPVFKQIDQALGK